MGVDPGGVPTAVVVDHRHEVLGVYEDAQLAGPGKKSGKKVYRTFDAREFSRILAKERPDMVMLEAVHCWPGFNLISMDLLITSARLVEGVCIGQGIEVRKVEPKTWQKEMAVEAKLMGKGGSLLAAQWLCKKNQDLFALAKHHNRADAALLAIYGLQAARRALIALD